MDQDQMNRIRRRLCDMLMQRGPEKATMAVFDGDETERIYVELGGETVELVLTIDLV